MEWPPIMDKWRWFSRFWDWWYTDINGFYFRDFDMENEDGRVARVMGCRYLNDSGLCSQYFWRPAICRQWPRIEYSCLPHLLKGCGYHIELYADHKQDLDLHPNKPKDENEPQSKNNTKASKLDHK
jgi:Fe-S-cluster containining protein